MGVQRLDTGQKPAVGKEKPSFLVLASQDSDQTASSYRHCKQVAQNVISLAATWLICGFRPAGKLLRARQAVRN